MILLAAGVVAVAILVLTSTIIWSTLKMSTATDALTAKVEDVNTAISGVSTQVGNAVTEIAALRTGPDETAVVNATSALDGVRGTLDGLSKQISDALAAPTAT